MSSDMGELFRAWREQKQRQKQQRLVRAIEEVDDGGWTKHTEYHWSRMVPGNPYPARLDYWPTTDKYRLDDLSGNVMTRSHAREFILREILK